MPYKISFSIFLCVPFTSLVHNQIPLLNYILTNRKLVFKLFVQDFRYTPVLSIVPFEEYFKDIYNKRALYEAFPLTNIIKVDDEEFMEKYEERQKILSNK